MMFRVIFMLGFLCSMVFASDFHVDLSSQTLTLGQVCRVIVKSPEPLTSYKLMFLGRSFKLVLVEKGEDMYRYESYVAASRSKASGEYMVKVDLRAKGMKRFYQQYKITLDHVNRLKKGRVALTKKAKKISKNKKAYRKEGRVIEKGFSAFTYKKRFTGPFLKPSVGRISSRFAKERLYNNGRVSSHAGVDISNKIGTPVISPENGVVVMGQRLTVHGNTIMLDHGMGVISIFCHLHTMSVREGDVVAKGDMIGTIGRTGVVSGAHLHWGLSVQNVRVDPLHWLSKESLLF
ncbi:hypothetical protein DID78_06860 [Candidatus Marinamargulisbacteria bacterium SCGC AG-343-D04]|nr:hypothetical protein DID78_06860 [Candidatus Marinamargulisbacteria bacterium SCGC AG-343-D04]